MSDALFNLELRNLSRSKSGGGPVAKAAYRACAKLESATGKTFDYSRGAEAERHRETLVLCPPGAKRACSDIQGLWREIDRIEKRSDARYAREAIIALPREASPAVQAAALKKWAVEQLVARGAVCQISIHEYGTPLTASGKRVEEFHALAAEIAAGNLPVFTTDEARLMRAASDPRLGRDHVIQDNGGGLSRWEPHAHCMFTDRPFDPATGNFSTKKDRSWNSPDFVLGLRKGWETAFNSAAEAAGLEARIDCRSNDARGIEAMPEPKLGHSPSSQRRADYLAAREARAVERQRRQIERALAAVEYGALRPIAGQRIWAPRWAVQALVDDAQHARWVNFRDGSRGLAIRLRCDAEIVDRCSSIAFGRGSATLGNRTAQATAMIRLAVAKGWTAIDATGGIHDQIDIALAAARHGIVLNNCCAEAKQAYDEEVKKVEAAKQAQANNNVAGPAADDVAKAAMIRQKMREREEAIIKEREAERKNYFDSMNDKPKKLKKTIDMPKCEM